MTPGPFQEDYGSCILVADYKLFSEEHDLEMLEHK